MRRGSFRKAGNSKPVIYAVAILSILTAGLLVAGFLSSSGSKGFAHESTYERYDSGFVIAQPGSYDSIDTAVVKEIDTDKKRITFMNVETGRYYTLDYDGTTVIQDKYGGSMSMANAERGYCRCNIFKEQKEADWYEIIGKRLDSGKSGKIQFRCFGKKCGSGRGHLQP